MGRLFAMNMPEWYYILVGCITSKYIRVLLYLFVILCDKKNFQIGKKNSFKMNKKKACSLVSKENESCFKIFSNK